ncbi:Autophagy protein 22 [Gamsiella multidivaricata]|nr:Autophagy protein 22 [Gamsiella multidivaricata]
MRVSFSPAPAEPPTTKKELWAWYSYAFASEAYVVALASEEGHLYGTNEPCIARPNITGITGITALNTGTNAQVMERPRCMISFGHLEVDTASFVMYLTSLAVFLQDANVSYNIKALTVVSISSMADYGSYRKKQLIAFSAIGATATMLIGAVPYVWMAGALSVIANVSFGAGIVCFNAYLPLLVRNVERLRRRREQLLQLETEVEVQSGHPIQSLAADVSNDMSEMAGAGHVHGTDDARATLLHDQEQPDAAIPEIPETAQTLEQKRWLVMEMSEQLNEDKGHLMGQISAKGFASGYLGGILLLLACLYISYRDKSSTRSLKVGIFLSGLWWFLFAALAGVWLKQRPGRELRLEDRSQKHGSLWVASRYVLYSWSRVGATIVQARKLPSAFAFLISWFFLSDGYTSIANVALLFAKTSLQMPQTQLILLSLEVPIYLVPRGRESEFFGLYAITDKGSSWLGPLAVAAITDATHEIRYAFVFLLVLLSLPIPIIYFGVDMNQGRLDAEKASQELQQIQTAGEHGEQDRGEESERLLSSV